MKKLEDIRHENYVSHAQRKAVWAARNDEKKKANEAKDGDGANIVRDREFKEPKFKFKSHPYGSPEWHANKAEYEKFKAKQAAKKAVKKEAVEEKTLTPAEKKKREEIAKAMERENPGMDMKKKMAIATWQAKKVAEAKDPNEYDKEGDMMKNQLRQICSANEKLMKMVGDDDNLPEWVQNKVTKATDYIRSVRDYLDAENDDDEEEDEDESMEESVELDEISRDLARRYIRKVADKTNTGELSIKQVMKRRPGVNLAGKKAYPGVAGEPKVRATESVEQIDELSKKTLTSYVKKAAGDAVTKAYKAGDVRDKDSGKNYMKALGRQLGISTATNKLTKEEAEQIDELDKKTLGSYIKKASTNQIGNTAKVLAGKNDPETERARRRMGQRMSGIAKATDRLTKEEAEQIDELKKSTLGSYVKKASGNMAGNAAVAAAQASSSMGKSSPETKRNITNRMKGIAKATDKLTKEEVELDEGLYHVEYGRGGKLTHQVIAKDAKDAHQKAMAHLKKKNPKLAHPDYADTFNKPSITHVKGNEPRADKYKTEAVKSSDKKPEKYTRPDGKVSFRMVATDKKVIQND